MKLNKQNICIFLIIIFHIVGLIGFVFFDETGIFRNLTPWHLCFMSLLLIVSQPEKNIGFYSFLAISILAGLAIEYVGVHNSSVFGAYIYGETLGFKIAGVPLVKGINWFLVSFSTGMLVSSFGFKNILVKGFVGASLMVFLDLFIEPVAIKYDYWNWISGNIPMQNYYAWYVFSFLFMLAFFLIPFKKNNLVGVIMFITQLMFFIVLSI